MIGLAPSRFKQCMIAPSRFMMIGLAPSRFKQCMIGSAPTRFK